MKKSLVSVIGVAASLVALFGSAPASASGEFNGQTYEKAAESISSYGGTAVIRTREGSYLPTEKCIVVGSSRAKILDSSGRNTSGGTWYLDLNCNDKLAGEHPGNSAATPEGAKASKLRSIAKQLSKDYQVAPGQGRTPTCERDETYTKWCVNVCQRSGACSAELNQFLGVSA